MSHRVYISGRSLITCVGLDEEQTLHALTVGKTLFQSLEGLPVGLLRADTLHELGMLEQSSLSRGHDPVTKLAVVAALQLQKLYGPIPSSWGCLLGSSRGATHSLELAIEDFSTRKIVDAKTSPVTTANSLPSTVAKVLDLSGLHYSVSAACSTSLHAVGSGFALLKAGIIDGAIVGGVECAVTPFTLSILNRARVYSRYPVENPWPHRPLHPDRSGMVLADGAALLCIERRPTDPCVEILAYAGASESSGLTGVSSDGAALQLAILSAIKQSGLKLEDIDLIVGHGASTKKGDQAELACYHKVFGEQRPPLVFHKWLTGHTLGAAGSMSICLAIHHLTTNSLPIHPYFPELDRENSSKCRHHLRTALVVSLGFGGNAAVCILRQ